MASRISPLVQDQNLNVHYNGAPVGGKNNTLKAQKKVGLGGRKPLGDLSNSAKPVLTGEAKMQKPKNSTVVQEVTAYAKETINGKSVSKASNIVKTGNRKALSDISNSLKPQPQASKKMQNMKLIAVGDELDIPNSIAEEQFQHNHKECIKMQKAMDKKEFLITVGLDNEVIASPRAPTFSSKLEYDWSLHLEEMPEYLTDIYSSKKLQNSPLSSAPNSPKYNSFWEDYDDINFELDTPCNSP